MSRAVVTADIDLSAPPPPVLQSDALALDVVGLEHAFGARKALDGVSLSVRPGDFTVLLGLNGAGKTTLFALVTRLYHAQKGHIAVFGADMRARPAAALSRMGVVFQQPTLDLDLTVEQNLLYHASLHGMPGGEVRQRADAELARVGLLDRRRDRVRQLSGGQRRRVELARALLHDPALLLLDEPTVGLDIASRQFLLDHVRKLCTEQRLAVLWATHLIDEANERARVIVLHKGRILAQGPVPAVVAHAGAGNLRGAFNVLIGDPDAEPQQ
jgi:ABC-2 type transport system ATP-binding protein